MILSDPNVIQVRDEFFLAKRQYELTPGLLTDLSVCTLYHSLVNIRTASQLSAWLRDIARSPFHYENSVTSDAGVYGNIMGEVERIALELTDRQRQAAAKEFARLGSVDLRVIDYATSKFRHVIRKDAAYFDVLTDLSLRTAVADLLTAEDPDTLTGCLEKVRDSPLSPELRDYVDFAGTLSAEEAEAMLINNRLCGEDNGSVMQTIDAIRDSYAYCKKAIINAMSGCAFDKHLTATPHDLTISTTAGDSSCKNEYRIALISLDRDNAGAWLADGRHLDLKVAITQDGQDNEQVPELMEKAVLAVGEYLAAKHGHIQEFGDILPESREDSVIAAYETVKGNHANDILVLKQNGYYEAFGDDAVIAARALRHNLWLRPAGRGRRTAVLILTEKELAALRRHCSRVYVCSSIREPDDDHLRLQPAILNILLSYDDELPLEATVFEKLDRRLAVRGDLGNTHFPPKDLSRDEESYYRHIRGQAEQDAAVRALFLKKNGPEMHRLLTASYR